MNQKKDRLARIYVIGLAVILGIAVLWVFTGLIQLNKALQQQVTALQREVSVAGTGARLPREITAEALWIVDKNGRYRAMLGIRDNQPCLTLYDTNDNPRAVLTAPADDPPALRFLDESGKPIWKAP